MPGGGLRVFLSTFEKQLDAKRRLVVPAEFRALAGGAGDGVWIFPSIEADCLEGGGQGFSTSTAPSSTDLPFGDPVRSALETSVYAGMSRLAFDTAGRIVLPDELCTEFGLTDWVVVAGLGDRFQLWSRDAFRTHRAAQRLAARGGLAAHRNRGRAA